MILPADSAQAYEREGYLTGIDLFGAEEIGQYRRAFDALEGREGRQKCQVGLQAWHFKEEFIWRMATDARLLDAMEELMGPDLMLLSTHFFCKYPEEEVRHFVAWHQDITYWGLEPPRAETAWIAVDDSDVENGCMRVIPASHKGGLVPHGTAEREGNLLSINQEIPAEYIDESRAVDLELRAGQISIHSGQLHHASNPNRSRRRRCGLTVRFIPPEARQVRANSIGQEWKPILLRGEDPYGHHAEIAFPFPLS